jgi:hypothetical protein
MQNHFKALISKLLSAKLIVLLCLLSVQSFAQDVTIISLFTETHYKLRDPDSLKSVDAINSALASAESASRVLKEDAANERRTVVNTQNDFAKSVTMKNDYVAAVAAYTKNGHDPYEAQLSSYNTDLNNYSQAVSRHNSAVAASDALPATQRSATTVASLNSEKTDLDNWKARLNTQKSDLDNSKANLDGQREVLLKQKSDCEAAYLAASDQLKISKLRLKDILDQLQLCSYYADKCNKLLINKFKYAGPSVTNYFSLPAYGQTIAEINSQIDQFKTPAATVWGN